VLLPWANPLVLGREENPAVHFGIAWVKGGRLEVLRGQKFDKLGGFLFVFAKQRSFLFFERWMFLDLPFGFKDLRVHIILQPILQFQRVLEAFHDLMVTNEIHPQVGREVQFAGAFVLDCQIHREKAIGEAVLALAKLLRIHQQRHIDVFIAHCPAKHAILSAFERAAGSSGSPANSGQFGLFLRLNESGKKDRPEGEHKGCQYQP